MLTRFSGMYSVNSMMAVYASESIALLSRDEIGVELVAIDVALQSGTLVGCGEATCRVLVTLLNERLVTL